MAKDAGAPYEEVIQGAAKAFNLDPDILRGMAQTESGFDPDVISGKRKSKTGAVGIMQFMPETAKRFGVDPTKPEDAIFASAQYLRENLDKFDNDYTKAVAAYNWGENREAYKKSDWVKQLPDETFNYVNSVLGHAAKYGKPAEAESTGVKPAFKGSKAHLIPGAETDILPTPRKEMGLVERAKDIGKGLVEIPGAIIGGALQPIAAGYESLMTGRDVKQSGYQMKPVESQFAQDVLGGLSRVAETAKIPDVTPGMLTAPVRPAMAAGRQVATPVANELGMIKGAAENVLAERQAAKAGERAAQSFRDAPRIDAAQEASRLGINLNPAASNPTMRNRLTEMMVGAEDLDKAVAESNKNQWSRIAKNELDIPETATLSPTSFAKARQAANKPYEDIKKIGNFVADEDTVTALNDLRQSEALIGGKATKGMIDNLVDDAVARVQEGLTGKNLLDNISTLRKDARTIYKKTDLSPEQRAVADANIGIANALEGLVEKNLAGNPKLLEQFREARTKMAKSYAYENATDMNTGILDPLKIAQLTAKDNALTGDIAAIGKIAGNFPGAVSTAPRGLPAKAISHLTRSGLPGAAGFVLGSAVGAPGIGILTGAAAGQAAAKMGIKRVLKKGYQAKRAVPKDYRNTLAPVEKLNNLVK